MLKKLTASILTAVLTLPISFGAITSFVTPALATGASMSLTNTVDKDPVNRGDVLTYTITVKNTGSVDLTNSIVWINTPNLATYVAGSSNYQGFPGGSLKSLTDAWVTDHVNFGTIPVGKWIVLKYQTKVADNANNTNLIWSVANAQSEQTSRIQANASSEVFLANPSICAKKTADKSVVSPGDVVTYTIKICDNGNTVLNNVRLYDEVPGQVTYLNGTTQYTRGNTTIQITDDWIKDGLNVGDLSSENDGILVYQVKVNQGVADGTVIRNVVKLKSDQTPVWIECDNKITVSVKEQPKEKGFLKIFKFNDFNGDGVFEGADKAIGGFTFHIVGPGVDTNVTVDANGNWASGELTPGTYTISELDKDGWVHTTTKDVTVQVTKGQTTEARFGNKEAGKVLPKELPNTGPELALLGVLLSGPLGFAFRKLRKSI